MSRIFPERFCDDLRPNSIFFFIFIVSIFILFFVLYNRQPERYRNITSDFSSKKDSVQIAFFIPPGQDRFSEPALTGRFQGMTVNNLTTVLKQKYGLWDFSYGVVITSMEKNSRADLSGLLKGDMIISINRRAIYREADFNSILSRSAQGSGILFDIYRDKKYYYITMETQGQGL